MPHLESLNISHNHASISIGHTLVTFFLGMYGIFQPLYLYSTGVPIVWVVGYEILFWGISLLLVIPNYMISSRIGVRLSLALSWCARILFLISLASLGFLIEHYSLVLILLAMALLQRIASGFYWLPFHSLFAFSFSGAHEASGLGKLQALGRMSAILSPFIGATLLTLLPAFWFFIVIACGFTLGLLTYLLVSLPEKSFMTVYPGRILTNCLRRENLPIYGRPHRSGAGLCLAISPRIA